MKVPTRGDKEKGNILLIENAKGFWVKCVGAPVSGYDPGSLEWSFDVALDGATIDGEDAVTKLKSLGLKDRIKNKSDEKGNFLHLKRNAIKKDGEQAKNISVVDAQGQPWDDRKIGNGSILNVKVLVQEYGDTKKPKMTLRPMAIQVWTLVEYEGGGVNFPTKAAEDNESSAAENTW